MITAIEAILVFSFVTCLELYYLLGTKDITTYRPEKQFVEFFYLLL